MDTIYNITYFVETCTQYRDVLQGKVVPKNIDHGKNLNETFKKEYLKFVKDRKYFPACPLAIYKETYNERLKEYRSIRPDADEFDFLKEEWEANYRIHAARTNKDSFYKHLDFKPHLQNLDLSTAKIRNFIAKRIISLGHYMHTPYEVYYDENTTEMEYERDRWNAKPIRNPEIKDTDLNFDESLSNNVVNKNDDSEPTASQWALYHYILQKSKIKPWFFEKKKEFMELEKEYGRHWNNLQTKWNQINNTQGQEGYSKKDLKAVKLLLNSNYPQALPVLEELSQKLF
ncbi:hypothetical protein [Zunongwangia profunda]|jgi:hypothetical protein|uniref:hypothetical protein n=2 Tax=Zunongwangia profunda TaxID=398743 RepID=UPI00248DB17A|nr:hypothetical protein [Zunongwangia profunda]|tara:strand:+ start:1596 stop:2456 length:861 start_codon:yes stop_codon:yes gene_type:complete